jgi:alpha-2-macroglobulin
MLNTTKIKNRFKNYPHKKKLISSFLFLLVISLVTFFSPHKSVIENQTQYSDEAKKEVLGYNTPHIYISGGDNAYGRGGVIALASTDEPSVTISSWNLKGEVDVLVYEANEQALFDYLLHDADGKQVNKSVDTKDFRLIKSLKHTIIDNNSDDSGLLLPLEETGIYFLRISKDDISADSFVLRSGNGAIVKEGDNEFIFWGQNFKTGRSMTEGDIRVYNLQDKITQLENASFDENGIAKTRLSSEADIAFIRSNGDKAIIPINLQYLNSGYSWKSFKPKEIAAKFFTFTDRPLYRPGDTVYFKSVVRDDDDVRYSIPAGQVMVKIYDGWGEEDKIFERSYFFSGSGSIAGEYQIPESANTGNYRLEVSVPGREEDYFSYNYTYFSVEHFRKPEYSIEVEVKEDEYIAGDDITFEISGSYFSGQPLSEKEVEYTVFASEFYDYEYIRDTERYLSDDYRYSYWWGKEIDSGSVALNEDGIAEVDIQAIIPENKTENQIYAIEVNYGDPSGNPVFSRKNVLVYAGEYGIYKDVDGNNRYSSQTNEELKLPIALASHIKTNLNNISLVAEVKRENWIKYQEKDKKYPSYRKEEERLSPLSARTNTEGKATFVLTPTKPGSYVFTIKGEDARGNKVSRTFRKYVTSEAIPYYFGDKDNDLLIQVDKESYLPGETAKLIISSNTPDRDIFLSLQRGRTNRYQVVKMNGSRASVDIPLIDTDMPNMFANVSSFSRQSYDTGTAKIVVSPESKKMVVSVVPDKKSYAPGEVAIINVSTTDVGGSPVSAEVAVWVVDKAIFQLSDESLGDIFNTFWSERYNSTQESHSLSGISVYSAEMGGGCFAKGTKVLMGDGKEKEIQEIRVGDYVLTRENEKNKRLVKAKIVKVHEVDDNNYLIINSKLKITSDHKLWVNNSWRDAGSIQIGDFLTDEKGRAIKVDSIEWLKGKFKVYNLTVEKYNTFFADGVWVHNDKDGGGRTVFKDTAYWNPSAVTNDAGRAQVSFKLPDNLTTWVVAGVGATNDTKVGQSANELVVTKDVIIRPILPNILRTGDELVLSALVQNFTEEDYKFDIGFGFDAGEVKSATRTGELIKSGKTKQIFWDTKVENETPNASLVYSAIAQENDKALDKITQTIPVREFGFYETTAMTGDGNETFKLDLADDISEEKTSITLSLAPSILGSLPSAMNYLISYPYGCVEQTTSSLVPALIAKANSALFANALKNKNIDEIIEDGLKRLKDHQHNDGGWAWWGSGDSDVFVTAYVVEYLVYAKNAGIEVDPEMMSEAKDYLLRDYYLDESGSKRNYLKEGKNEDLVMKMYALTLMGEKEKVIKINNFEGMDTDILSYAVMSNFLQGDKDPKTNGLTKLISLAKTQGDAVYWEEGDEKRFSSNDASTALAIRAIILADGNREVAVKGVRYLTRNRKYDYWSNTFGTSQVVRAVTELSKTGDELAPNYVYTVDLDGKRIAQGSVNSPRQIISDIQIPIEDIKKDSSILEIKKNGEGQIYSTLVKKEFHTDRNSKAVENGLKITRSYINDKGERFSLGVGDTVTVRLSVSGLGADEYYGVIEDELPSGMIPINQSFKNEQATGRLSYRYGESNREITENGIVISLYEFLSGQTNYTYKARVISEGKFIAPPARVSLMYAPEINARTDAEIVNIDKESKLLPGKVVKESIVKGTSAKMLGVVLLIMVIIVLIILRKRGITRSHIKEKIKGVFNRIRRKPPIPPLQEKVNNDENESTIPNPNEK